MLAFVNGEFIPEQKAMLGVGDLSIQRGYAIFDFFRSRNFVPLFLQDYLQRFYNSAQGLRLPVPYSQEQTTKIIHELVEKNAVANAGFRLVLTGGYSNDS